VVEADQLAAPDKRCDVGHWRKINIVSTDPFVKARLGFDARLISERSSAKNWCRLYDGI
jgi:hypothetical protein